MNTGIPAIRVSNRHSGIDILRILAMFLVCALHCDERGMYDHVENNVLSQSVHMLWHNFSYMGVNLFMLITGYCCANTQWRFSRYVTLYLQVAFYSTGYILLMLLLPLMNSEQIWETVRNRCLSIPFAGGYWYFTTYTGLFFLIPFLNKLIHALSNKQFKSLAAALILVFSLLNTGSHSFISQGGQNLIWMIVCYLLGAYIQSANIPGNAIKWFILFVISLVISTTINHFIPALNRDYTALFFIFSCICIFISLTRIHIRSKALNNLLASIAPLSFGVYLFHDHPLLYSFVSRFALRIAYALDFSWISWVLAPCAIYIIGTSVDWLRARLFRNLGIPQLSKKVDSALTKMTEKFLRLN